MLRRYAGRYWLIAGAITYLGMAVPSIAVSAEGSLGDVAYIIVDWLAACVPYFFLGALVGFLVDRWFTREEVPRWAWLTLGFWLVSSFVVAIVAHGKLPVTLIVFFPFAFGIFLTGSAFALLSPTTLGKSLLDVAYLALAGTWLCAHLKRSRYRDALLAAVFLVLVLGLGGCVRLL